MKSDLLSTFNHLSECAGHSVFIAIFLRPCQLGRRLPAYGCHTLALSPALLLTGVLRLPPGLQLSFFDAEIAEVLSCEKSRHRLALAISTPAPQFSVRNVPTDTTANISQIATKNINVQKASSRFQVMRLLPLSERASERQPA